jgi:hypothetical protein
VIRVNRGNEPTNLSGIRAAELRRVRAIAAVRRPTEEEIGKAYQAVKSTLWTRQHFKCAFCESKEQAKRNDAEHFRPKTSAKRQPGCTEDHGYWWLTWTWSNLLFACRNCNQAPAKLDKFPLEAGSEALVAEQAPPANERPLLLDPAEENGIPHIQFKIMTPRGREEWFPTPRNGSVRGKQTIEVCMLDRPDLIDLYTEHVEDNVEDLVEVIHKAIDDRDRAAVWEAWAVAVYSLLSPSQQYIGLSWDALDHFVPLDVRIEWDLVLSLPGHH